ncbi:MAG: deoxynucleoside kinase [Bryobacteraceae bacterium]
MDRLPYIAFEGPIAAGKTTLATRLAAHLSSDLVLEEFDANEFLPDFYKDRSRWSLHMQLWFLSARIPALKLIGNPMRNAIVADYTSRKDPLFARLLLDERELRLFDRIAALAASELTQPDLIVFLNGETEILLDRIRRRGRRYEETIDAPYLNSLRRAYEEDLLHRGLNIVRYDTSTLDLNSATQMQHLYDAILAALPHSKTPC